MSCLVSCLFLSSMKKATRNNLKDVRRRLNYVYTYSTDEGKLNILHVTHCSSFSLWTNTFLIKTFYWLLHHCELFYIVFLPSINNIFFLWSLGINPIPRMQLQKYTFYYFKADHKLKYFLKMDFLLFHINVSFLNQF